MPHPTKYFGKDSIFHFPKGTPSECVLADHKKENNFFLNFCRMPFGMYAIVAL